MFYASDKVSPSPRTLITLMRISLGASIISAKLKKTLSVEAISALLHVVMATLGIPHLPSPVHLFGMRVEDTVKSFIGALFCSLCVCFMLTNNFCLFETSLMGDV